MDYFGDESGHFRGVLQDHEEVCVLAVVGGDRLACGTCPKRTVRWVTDVDEAKWHDLLDTQKRRIMECFADQDILRFGYALFTREKLHTITLSHLLYQNVNLPPEWDLALAGYAYGDILFEMGAQDETRAIFEFDRVSSKKQSEKISEHVTEFVPGIQTFIKGSRASRGIQAADCIAGAIAEDYRHGTGWMDILDRADITESSYISLTRLENDLHEYDTGP